MPAPMHPSAHTRAHACARASFWQYCRLPSAAAALRLWPLHGCMEASEGAAVRSRLAQQEDVLHALHLKLATATELLGETRTLPE
jgi:hypothetical protein